MSVNLTAAAAAAYTRSTQDLMGKGVEPRSKDPGKNFANMVGDAVSAAHDIPIVENPPLSRTLHAAVETGEELPIEHYKAVAEIIGYVLRLKGKMPNQRRRAR